MLIQRDSRRLAPGAHLRTSFVGALRNQIRASSAFIPLGRDESGIEDLQLMLARGRAKETSLFSFLKTTD